MDRKPKIWKNKWWNVDYRKKTFDHKPKILKNGWWNVIFRKESWTVDHFLSRPLHSHHRLHIIQATRKESVYDKKISINTRVKKVVLLKLH